MALAKLCFDTLMEEGVKAKIALEAGVCTPAVEKVIEANTLLSGIGFESAGLARSPRHPQRLHRTRRVPSYVPR